MAKITRILCNPVQIKQNKKLRFIFEHQTAMLLPQVSVKRLYI